MTCHLLTGHQTAYAFLDKMVNDFIDDPVVEACNCFLLDKDKRDYPDISRRAPYHGYHEDKGCFVHAPENYAWFLTHFATSTRTKKIIRAPENCAEHVSNWSPNAEPWYEWEYHRFSSAIFCTRKVCD